MVVPTTYITGIKFGLSGDDKIVEKAHFEVKNSEIIKNDAPAPDGVYDMAMGSTERDIMCSTCLKYGGKCLGHNGYSRLVRPVLNPISVSKILPWLKIICHECCKPHSCTGSFAECMIIMKKQAPKNKVHEVVSCIHCKTIQRKYVMHPKLKLMQNAISIDSNGKEKDVSILYPTDISRIFNGISDESIAQLGLKNAAHPKNFVINTIQAAANTTRAQSTKSSNGTKSGPNDITKMIKCIIETNAEVASPEKAEEKQKKNTFRRKINDSLGLANDNYVKLIYAAHQYIKSPIIGDKNLVQQNSDSMPLSSMINTTKSKKGIVRKNILGKRARNLCRSTITGGNPRLPIYCLGFPYTFATKIHTRTAFTRWSESVIMSLLANAKNKTYPMATRIIKPDGKIYPVSKINTGMIGLNYGDYIEHELRDGDYVNFNRQPTLELCSISGHFLKIHKDRNAKTLGMNVIACDFYNADFDGDEMNTQHSKYAHVTYELRKISAFNNFVISNTNGSPQIGQINDSIVGLYMLTKNDVRMNRREAMSLFANTTLMPRFDKDEYTGREIISLCLEKTPVNYTGKPTSYDISLEPYMDYDPSEKKTIIKNGVMLSGVLDKSAIGSGGHKNLYHIIESDYGADAMLEVMFNMQQISIDFILLRGFSLGTKDILMNDAARSRIQDEESNLINESKIITDRLNRGAIIPPIGKTVKEFYEEQQINALRPGDVYNEIILRNIPRKDNGLLNIILSGSKGKINNYMAITARAGQMLINGERLRENAGYKRTSVYCTRFDDDPRAYGYITNSYTSGQTVMEYFSNASNARFDLITKALSTSVTGDKNRNAVKNLESILVDNMFRCMRDRNVVQLLEGEDGFNPQKVEKVSLDFVKMSSEALRKKYSETLETEFMQEVISCRNEMAKTLLDISRMKISMPAEMKCRSPFDIHRIVANKIGDVQIRKSGEVYKNWKFVKKFIDLFPRMFLNSRYTGPVHKHFQSAMTNIRCYLTCTLADYAPYLTESQLQVVFDLCCDKFYRALVNPGTAIGIQTGQCICAPMTQYMLDSHTRSASGGTAKDSMDHVQDIVGAVPPEKIPIKNKMMHLVPKPEFIQDKNAVQMIANSIEMMSFGKFVTNSESYFEKYGSPVHPKTEHEKEDLEKFNKITLQKRPNDLINWVIRYELNKTELILKGMSVQTIVKSLREQNPDCYFTYASDINSVAYVRQYFRPLKKAMDIETSKKIINLTLDQVIRGISGIQSAQVIHHQYTDPETFEVMEGWAVKTIGSNIAGVITHPGLDPDQVHSSCIIEVERFFGIIAARNKIVVELDVIASGGDPRHKFLYADEMTRIGRVVNIERTGLAVREPNDILGRVALASPAKAYIDAAINSIEQEVSGISDRLILGDIPKIGTMYNQKILNIPFIQENVKNVSMFADEFD